MLWEDEKNYITIQNNSTGDTKTLSSDYLIGADGGGSFVRKQMGSELKSLGKSIHFLIVDINAPRSALQPGRSLTVGGTRLSIQMEKGRRHSCCARARTTGHTRTLSGLNSHLNKNDDHAKIQSPDSIKQLVSPYLVPDEIKIVRSTIYKFNSLFPRNGERATCSLSETLPTRRPPS